MSPGSLHICTNAYADTRDEVPEGRNKRPEKGRLSLPLSGMLNLLRKLQLLCSLRCHEHSEQERVQLCLRVTESSTLALQLSPALFPNRWS